MVTAVIVGVVSLSGGVGNIQRTAIGVLIIGVLVNGTSLAGIPSYYQTFLQGIVLLIAVLIDSRRTGGYR